MPDPTRAQAWALLCEFTKAQPLRRHALSVEASMRALARRAGVPDAEVELWGIVGMLHDFDYERFPTAEDHVWRGMEILRARGWPEPVIRAVGAHAPYTGIAPETPMERAIVAADELSGFVGACALVRPTKRIADVPVESVVKRMKEKAFARSVDREYIRRGAEEAHDRHDRERQEHRHRACEGDAVLPPRREEHDRRSEPRGDAGPRAGAGRAPPEEPVDVRREEDARERAPAHHHQVHDDGGLRDRDEEREPHEHGAQRAEQRDGAPRVLLVVDEGAVDVDGHGRAGDQHQRGEAGHRGGEDHQHDDQHQPAGQAGATACHLAAA